MNELVAVPDESDTIHCCTCGLPVTTREIHRLEGEPCCRQCLSGFALAVRQALERPAFSGSLIPWLRREELGVVRAFVQTVGAGLSHPTLFFARLPAVSQPWAPLLFAVLCTVLFYFPGLFINYTFILPTVLQELESQQIPNSMGPALNQMAHRVADLTVINWMMFLVEFVVIHVIFASWIQQVLVSLAGGRRGFDVTLQVRCYSLVGMSFHLIPVVGLFIGQIYCIAINALGLRQVHGISWASAVAAILPLLILWWLPLAFLFRMFTLGAATGAG
jgi:hypothetical protein